MESPSRWLRGPQFDSARREELAALVVSARRAWEEIEVGAITERYRPSALVILTAEELVTATQAAAGMGLASSVAKRLPGGKFLVAIYLPQLAKDWAASLAANDHEAIGALLGYPECCRAAFVRNYLPSDGSIEYDPLAPWQTRLVLRALGVRLIPYIPCTPRCVAALYDAGAYLDVGRSISADVGAIERLLSSEIVETTVGGVTEVEVDGGAIRFSTGGDSEEIATGSASYADNGFPTDDTMRASHSAILTFIAERTEFPRLFTPRVLDLGCGDGALLARLCGIYPTAEAYGVENNPGRLARGKERHGDVVAEFISGRIEDVARWRRAYALVLLMPGRLLELAPARAAEVRDALFASALEVVLYAYPDWTRRFGGLAALAAKAGLEVEGRVEVGAGGLEVALARSPEPPA